MKILSEREYRQQFKSDNKFSALIEATTSILESDKSETLKIELLAAIIQLAKESVCSVSGCDKPTRSKGLCATHYSQQLEPKLCKLPGCGRKAVSHGYCSMHWNRINYKGVDPTDLETLLQPPTRTGGKK